MWIRRAKWAAVVILVTLAVAATVLILLWRDRPELYSECVGSPGTREHGGC